MNDGKRQVTDETEPDENPIATIYYENGTELTGKAVTLQDGTVGVRIPGEFFKTALLPDGSMPDGVISVDIGPKHVEGGLPLTDDMVCMAVTAMLRDAVGLTSGEGVGCVRGMAEPGEKGHNRALGGLPAHTRIHATALQVSRP